jgi:4-hydroxybenzoate polyprenyltransferase
MFIRGMNRRNIGFLCQKYFLVFYRRKEINFLLFHFCFLLLFHSVFLTSDAFPLHRHSPGWYNVADNDNVCKRWQGTTSGKSSTRLRLHDDTDGGDLTNICSPPSEVSPTKQPRIKSNFTSLFQLTRPANFPGVILFHLVGIYVAVNSYVVSLHGLGILDTKVASGVTTTIFRQTLLRRPSLWLMLMASLLTCSTSMVVNDYYDAKLGRDDHSDKSHYLAAGLLSPRLVKHFLMYQYAICLLLVPFLPGALTRLIVIGCLIATFLYTEYLKPITWMKNIACAMVIALAPLTSCAATLNILPKSLLASHWEVFKREVILLNPALRLTLILLLGVVSREILMDCNDMDNDRIAAVLTVPVVYGRRFATRIAFACVILMSTIAMTSPIAQTANMIARALLYPVTMSKLISVLSAVINGSLATLRRALFATIGSILTLRRYVNVVQTEASDKEIVDKAVDESLVTVLFFLLSFV